MQTPDRTDPRPDPDAALQDPSRRTSEEVPTAETVDRVVKALARGNGTPWRTQRSFSRHEVLCRALVWRTGDPTAREPTHAQLVNLSTGGVGLLVGVPLAIGDRFKIEMTVEDIGLIQWSCVVRWCNDTDDSLLRIGAEFKVPERNGIA